MLRVPGRRFVVASMLSPVLARAQDAADAAASPGWLSSVVPEGMRRTSFLLENWQWIGLLALVMGGVIADRLTVTILRTILTRITKRFLTRSHEGLVRSTVRPLGILSMAVVWRLGLDALGLTGSVREVLSVAVAFLAAGAGVWAAYRLVDILAEYLAEQAAGTETRYDDLLVPMVRKSLKVFIVAFGLVFIADNLNVDITSLLAGLGLGGLAFALAAQDMVKNLFGSLTVLLDRPFQVGDWVKIGDLEGTVEEVGFRSSRIRTFYNSLITMPNANLISTAVDNLGMRSYRRWKATLSVTYDTPPEKLDAFCEGIRELVRRHPHTTEGPLPRLRQLLRPGLAGHPPLRVLRDAGLGPGAAGAAPPVPGHPAPGLGAGRGVRVPDPDAPRVPAGRGAHARELPEARPRGGGRQGGRRGGAGLRVGDGVPQVHGGRSEVRGGCGVGNRPTPAHPATENSQASLTSRGPRTIFRNGKRA
jgi:small-conductance mechanosensitive channel